MDIQERLQKIRKAIEEDRAFLDTNQGRRKVTSYNHETGWAVTGNGEFWGRRSFMVCLDSILIQGE